MAIIVVVDDHREIRRTIARQLASASHEVYEAADGAEGLAVCRRHKPALVICDIFMPGMEGIETIRAIRGEQPAVKIIAMSGSEPSQQAHYLKAAQELGADAVLAKPWRVADFLALVKRLLEA